MLLNKIYNLLSSQFPTSEIPKIDEALQPGSFEEWDSLGHFNFLLAIEDEFAIRFTVDEMTELKTLNDIKRALIQKGSLD